MWQRLRRPLHRRAYFGDPAFDGFLANHDCGILNAIKEAEQSDLNPLGLLRSIRRDRKPGLRYNNVVLKYVKQAVPIRSLAIGSTNNIDGRGTADVADMTQLVSLNLNGLPITDTGLKNCIYSRTRSCCLSI